MKTTLTLTFLALAGILSAAQPARQTINFDSDWRFFLGEAKGAEAPSFDDRGWKAIRLPHDWAISGPVAADNPSGRGGGYFPAGIGWYRKSFALPGDAEGGRVFVEFDGIMANSDVWINGHLLGHRPYGYISFSHDLTPFLNKDGQPNVLTVRVDDVDQPASRWYPGAGIYRHVRLVETGPVHLTQWGTIITTPEVGEESATVSVSAEVSNTTAKGISPSVRVELFAPDGSLAASAESAGVAIPMSGASQVAIRLPVAKPRRWDLEHPSMYQARVSVLDGSRVLDEETLPFGIRDARFEAESGFRLNGKVVKLKGVCLHDDASAFGAAVPLDAWRLRLEALKAMGANAIRTAHNPPAPEFLDLCDQMGFLVMDEDFDCWTVAKNPYDYHLAFNDWSKTDVRDMVRRDRNHPSIILWSAGNEIHDTPQADLAKKILSGLIAVFHENDPTRPVTQALLRPNVSHDYDDGLSDMLDVVGTNYRHAELLAEHARKPATKIVGTENRHDLESWQAVRDHAAYSGEFIWSGFDYLGEARAWPEIASGSGLFDRTDLPKPDGMIVRSWWDSEPMVWMARRKAPTVAGEADPGYGPLATTRRPTQVLFADWNPQSADPHEENVEVYSNCPDVELVLNGTSLGSKPIDPGLAPRKWSVAYAPGNLRAIGRSGGKVVAECILRTAEAPVRVRLDTRAEKTTPGWDHLVQVRAQVVDANGLVVPSASDEISFAVEGPGDLVAVDSADNESHEPFQSPKRKAYQGLCVAYLRATGTSGVLKLTASAPGLAADSIQIPVEAR